MSRALPTSTRRPSTVADAPWPGMFSNSLTCCLGEILVVGALHDRLRQRVLGRPFDCGDKTKQIGFFDGIDVNSTTSGSPLVSVPVLSMTTVWIRADVSSADAFLNRMPRSAPRPVPTMIAVGVASPNASGQVMTTTVIAKSIASLNGTSLKMSQAASVAAPPTSATKPAKTPRVGQALTGRLRTLRLLHQFHDLRERRIATDLRRLELAVCR